MNASEPREDAVAGHDDFAEWLARDWPLYHVNGIVAVRMRSAWNAALAQQGAEPVAWQPIETAPKDAPLHSISVLVYLPAFGVFRGQYTRYCAEKGEWPWLAEGFSGMANRTITHWQPLPAAPTGAPR